MSKSNRINQVMTAALGDASVLAVRELEQMFSIKEAHITKHALPVILRHLNRQNMIPIEASDWASSPKILNALSCFGMITSAFRQCAAASVPPMESVYQELTDPLWPLILDWSLYFIRRSRILENDEHVIRDIEVISSLERVIHALSTWKDVANSYLMPNADNDEFLQTLASVWVVCMGSSGAVAADLTNVLSMVISGEASPGRVGPITEAFQSEAPGQVCRAVLSSVISLVADDGLDLHHTKSVLSLLSICTNNVDVLPQLVENGVMSWLTRLARRMTSRRTPSKDSELLVKAILRLFTIIHNLMIFGYKAIVRAVEARVLEAVLRAEACFTRLGNIDADDEGSLMQLSQEIVDGVIHYLIYSSVVTAARKAIKRIQRSELLALIDPNLRFLAKWTSFTDSVASQYQQNSVFKNVILYKCANPSCARSPGDFGGNTPLMKKRCSGCLRTAYCSVACQRVHWRDGHKRDCRAIRRTVPDAFGVLDVAIPQTDEEIIMFQASHDVDLYADEIASGKLHTTVPASLTMELPVILLDYRNSSDHGRVQITAAYLQDCRNFWSVTEEVTWYSYLHQAREMANEGSDLVLVVTPYAPLMPATRLTSIQRLSSCQHNSSCIGHVNE